MQVDKEQEFRIGLHMGEQVFRAHSLAYGLHSRVYESYVVRHEGEGVRCDALCPYDPVMLRSTACHATISSDCLPLSSPCPIEMLSSPVIILIMELLPEPVAPMRAMIFGSMIGLDQFHIRS